MIDRKMSSERAARSHSFVVSIFLYSPFCLGELRAFA